MGGTEFDDSESYLGGTYLNPDTANLQDSVDELELGLASALLKFRSRAEDLLSRHMEFVEKRQAAQDMEIANLKAENAILRQKIGADVNFASKCMLQSASQETKKGANKNSMKSAKNTKQKDEEDYDTQKEKGLGGRGKKGVAAQAGGTWQHFVAWVPIGAGLSNPEPWKPMPPLDALAPVSPGQAQGTARGKTMKIKDEMLSVLPGQVELSCTHSERSSNTGRTESDEKFELLELWEPSKDEVKKKLRSRGDSDGQSAYSGNNDEEDGAFEEGNRSLFIINPDSTRRIVWDFTSLSLVVYDMIMIPMFSFELPESTFFIIMEWTTRLFWTSDMGWSCCTGVVLADGRVEYQFQYILRRYFKSWFLLDVFIVGSDWAGFLFLGGGVGQYGQLARISRIVRVVRLLRLLRMQEVIANVTERIQSDNVGLVIQIIKLFVFLAAVSHVFGCLWFTVGVSDQGSSWIELSKYDHVDVGRQYLVCLFWAVSQFLGTTDTLSATNDLELFYSICVAVFAFMALLVMISIMTSSLTQQYIIGGSGARQMDTLKKYLKQNSVSKNLSKRLCRNAKHAVSGDLTPDAVQLLGVISEPLLVELHFEMYARILAWHPFFHEFLTESTPLMRRVCHQCMSTILLASGDVVFGKGEEPSEPRMYIVVTGTLDYMDAYAEVTVLSERQWIAEPTLWTTWKHRGTLTATSDVKLAMLDAESFQRLCKHDMRKNSGGFNPKLYAREFVDELNKSDYVTDLYDPNH